MEALSTAETRSVEQFAAQTETRLTGTPDQRAWIRLAKTEGAPLAIVTGSEGLKSATIEDVSMGGIGLRVADGAAIVVGKRVEIEFQGESFQALVRYAIDHAQGGYRVGMEWTEPTAPALQALMKYLLAD
jgi:hypothetical protein